MPRTRNIDKLTGKCKEFAIHMFNRVYNLTDPGFGLENLEKYSSEAPEVDMILVSCMLNVWHISPGEFFKAVDAAIRDLKLNTTTHLQLFKDKEYISRANVKHTGSAWEYRFLTFCFKQDDNHSEDIAQTADGFKYQLTVIK